MLLVTLFEKNLYGRTMKKLTLLFVISVSTVLAGCSTASKDISARYVSPIQYSSYDCSQLQEESYRITRIVTELGGRLDEAASNDKAITGVGVILFWPALFALGGTGEQEAEYARLKGEYDAVQQALIQKKCSQSNAPNNEKANAPSSEAVIIVGKPQGGVFISPTVYRDYSCNDLNEEFIGVSNASLHNLLGEADNLTSANNRSILGKHRQKLNSQNYENDEANSEARLYALTKASKRLDGCEMYMNKKRIILSE